MGIADVQAPYFGSMASPPLKTLPPAAGLPKMSPRGSPRALPSPQQLPSRTVAHLRTGALAASPPSSFSYGRSPRKF
eukprot:NODE_5389_length_512_cov_114.494600_g4007_i0.p2 GENE.NODE_5389_length_512_cov_114.494600_g4007_i0~~NODE_5389_length_512_cov_114.494600_g4007_i0.p2  ORF type:complete len:87 (+),score=29.52 NODE_5389_length_512_cov_114.494600_g4007_i0:32-262(+)